MIDRAQEMGIRALSAAQDTDVLEQARKDLVADIEFMQFTIQVIDEELAHRQTEQPKPQESV